MTAMKRPYEIGRYTNTLKNSRKGQEFRDGSVREIVGAWLWALLERQRLQEMDNIRQ